MAAEGHEVRVASGAEEALDRLGELRPDVVLYDAESFGSEASQAIARFREQAGRHRLIALTGGPSPASGGGGGGGGGRGGAGGAGGAEGRPGIHRADFAFPRPTNLDELRRVLREA